MATVLGYVLQPLLHLPVGSQRSNFCRAYSESLGLNCLGSNPSSAFTGGVTLGQLLSSLSRLLLPEWGSQ